MDTLGDKYSLEQDRPQLVEELKEHEGLKFKPYLCPSGKITIGYGTNLSDGISLKEARWLFFNRLSEAEETARVNIDYYKNLSPKRQEVIIELIYNMGWPRFSGFIEFARLARLGDYKKAAHNLLYNFDGKPTPWSLQVGKRAQILHNKFLNG